MAPRVWVGLIAARASVGRDGTDCPLQPAMLRAVVNSRITIQRKRRVANTAQFYYEISQPDSRFINTAQAQQAFSSGMQGLFPFGEIQADQVVDRLLEETRSRARLPSPIS